VVPSVPPVVGTKLGGRIRAAVVPYRCLEKRRTSH
jgi:hypothetical protein